MRCVVMLAGLLPVVLLSADEPPRPGAKPPYQRLLQGDEAKQAADLEKQVEEKEAADQYAQAIAAAEQLLALRTRGQGADHPDAVLLKWTVETLRKVATMTPDERAAWRAADSCASGHRRNAAFSCARIHHAPVTARRLALARRETATRIARAC